MSRARLLLPGLLLGLAAVSAANAQTVSIVSGNGQLVCQLSYGGCKQTYDSLVVKVVDANGSPLSGVTVSWTATLTVAASGGAVYLDNGTTTSTSTTDSNGKATMAYYMSGPLLNVSLTAYQQAYITAAYAASSVQFIETQSLTNTSSSTTSNTTYVTVTFPTATTLTGGAGATSTSPLLVQVLTTGGYGIANVSVHITTDDVSGGATVACQTQSGQPSGYILTDSSGYGYCYPVFGSVLSSEATFKLVVGDSYTGATNSLVVTVGTAGLLQIVRGDNQTAGVSGKLLGAPLVAKVSDLGGNAVSNAEVTWQVVPSTAGTIYSQVNKSAEDGLVSVYITVANPTGTFQVKATLASNTSVSVTFTVNAATVTISGLSKLSGDGQDAAQGTAFSSPLVVQAVTNGTATSGVAVAFAITSGSATLSSSSATTDSQGQASVTVTAGQTLGTVTVSATAGTYSQTFTLTVRTPGPSLTSDSVLNGASFLSTGSQSGGISPCSIATIRASGLATGIQGTVVPSNSFGPLPYKLAGDQVTVGGKSAPIFSVINSNSQESVTVQVPCEVTAGTQTVEVTVGTASKTASVQVKAASPGIFESTQSDSVSRAIVLRQDGSFVSPSNPARRGEAVKTYVTGMGAVSTSIATNQVPAPGVTALITGTAIVGLNNSGVQVNSVKLAENLIGVYEVEFVIPSDMATGDNITLSVAVNPADGSATQFSQGSKLPIQ